MCIRDSYNALRGLNSGERQEWLLQIGRNEPDAYSVESQARCWFADEPDFKPGTVFRGPTSLIAKDSRTVMVTTTQFEDKYCQAMMAQAREAESIQAIDRLRLVHVNKPKIIFILSNQPLPGITPDHLVKLDDLLLPGRLATVLLRDQAITGPAMLAQRHPDLFKDQQAAKDALRESSMGDFPNNIYIGKLPIEAGPPALIEIRYRTARQRGGKNRKAWLYPSADPAAILSAIHGELITLINEPNQEPAWRAEPEPIVPTPEPAPPHAEPEPTVPESPAPAPGVAAPPAPLGEGVIKEKVGNTEPVLGYPFDPDCEHTETTRSVVWRITMQDGHTCTLRIPENPDQAEAEAIAQRMIPSVQAIRPLWATLGIRP